MRWSQGWRRAVAVLGLAGALILALGGTGRPAAAALPAPALAHSGVIRVLAVDNRGQGFAWSDSTCRTGINCVRRPEGGMAPAQLQALTLAVPPAAQPAATPTSILWRIDQGQASVLADSLTAPTLLVPGLDVWRMVITADGQEGWAAGRVTSPGQAPAPALMRLHNGDWSGAADLLTPDFIPIDISLSADGATGWLSAQNLAGQYKLLRWDGTAWAAAAVAPGVALTRLAVSADGKHGWAVGVSGTTRSLYQLGGQGWTASPGSILPAGLYLIRVTADNTGNGWLLADQGTATNAPGILYRLTPGGAPSAVAVNPLGGGTLTRAELTMDAAGRGFLTGSVAETGQAVFAQISGDQVTVVPTASLAVPPDFALPATIANISPDGHTLWMGNAAGQLTVLRTTPPPNMPRTGGPDGAAPLLPLALGLLALLAGALLTRRVASSE